MNPWKNCSQISIPDWLVEKQSQLTSKVYASDMDRMGLVLECAKTNFQLKAGEPLAAAVFRTNGELISVGVDAPGIGGHEMTNALIIASNVLGPKNFRGSGDWELFSLAPPCSICQGNIYSERPKRFVCAVDHKQLKQALSLPHTPFPDDSWIKELNNRNIEVRTQIMNQEAKSILESIS